MNDQSSTYEIRSVRFRKEREAGWSRLEELVKKVEKDGMTSLSFDEAKELAATYRQIMNSLSVAREISLDEALLGYLENLAARSYLVVYAPQARIGSLFGKLFKTGIPQAVRRSWPVLLVGFGMMFLGALLGFALFQQDETWFYTLIPGELAQGRNPSASYETLYDTIYDSSGFGEGMLSAFAATLFSHNTQVAILVFSLGIFYTVPSFVLTFYNGALLGAFFAMFADAGLGYDIFAWLSIHGVTELSAICIACAGGFHLGMALLMPGKHTRRDALRINGRDATKLLILAGLMLIAAAILEGFFRQTVQSPELRLTIGWGIGLLWFVWLAFSGRENTGASK